MSNLEDKFEQLLGEKLTDRERQKLLKMGKILEISDNDALWTILALHYCYDRQYAAIPAQIEKAAIAAAESSAKQAEAHINEAVKLLAPTVKSEVKRAVKDLVGRVQLGESLFTIFGAIMIVGIFGGVCFLLGNHTYGMFQEQKINSQDFWEHTKWAISSGFIVPGLLISGYLVLKLDDYDWRKLGVFLILFGVGITAVLPLKLLGVVH